MNRLAGIHPASILLSGAMLAAALLVAGCGNGSQSTGSGPAQPSSSRSAHRPPASTGLVAACPLIPVSRVAAIVRGAGGNPGGLRRRSTGSAPLTYCSFRGHRSDATLTLDADQLAVTGYFNRITEFEQAGATTPALRPRRVRGIGDRRTPGYGANWVPASNLLLSVRSRRALLVTFYARGASTSQLKRGAIDLTRLAYAALGLGRNRGAG